MKRKMKLEAIHDTILIEELEPLGLGGLWWEKTGRGGLCCRVPGDDTLVRGGSRARAKVDRGAKRTQTDEGRTAALRRCRSVLAS